jgi:amino acid permease
VTLTIFPLAMGLEELIEPYLTSDRMVHVVSAAIKLVITALALMVAICVPSFSFLCSLVGMVCTMSVSVILPAAAHYRLFASRLTWPEKLLDGLFVVIGLSLAVAGTIATI